MLDRQVTVTLTPEGPPPDDPYTRGVLAALGERISAGVESEADLPAGAGLGSSAAYEVALLRALRDAFDLDMDDRELALVAWRAETEHVGVPCGVMDQLASSLGRPGEALLIDCRSLETRAVAVPDAARFEVHDSGVRHANATSGYAERRRECDEAATALGVRALRDVAADDPRLASMPRARHVVEENARVLAFADALEAGDLATCGRLMNDSHASQRDLFDVSVPEVDALVERCLAEGALGARLTGGGFGGSVVALSAR